MTEKSTTFREPFRPRVQKIWRSIKRRYPNPNGFGGLDVDFSTRSGPWRVAVETTRRGGFGLGTEFRTQIHDPDGLEFTIHRTDALTNLVKRFTGAQDIEVGDSILDARYEIQGSDVGGVLRFLDNWRIRHGLRSGRGASLSLGPSKEDRHFEMTSGVSEFIVRFHGALPLHAPLAEAYHFFAECVCQLAHDSVGYERDLEIDEIRLTSPELVRRADRLLYDGWAERLRAVEAVVAAKHTRAVDALETSLREGPPELRASAARALGALGDTSAVTALIDHLSDPVKVDHRTVGAWAGEALGELGQWELASDVFAALAGTPIPGWVERVDPRREAVLVAILRALETNAWRHALRALVELNAGEVLPSLKEAYRVASSRSARGQVLKAVIAELEGQSVLPRPAEAPKARYDTLPRSAKEAEPDRTGLPRPTSAGEE